ncbi:MAG: hypothetical protein GDA52_06415 [Rhodobacteraceae bacterium]|nr:hypothetical protein [Paracoccaceae bacterium]
MKQVRDIRAANITLDEFRGNGAARLREGLRGVEDALSSARVLTHREDPLQGRDEILKQANDDVSKALTRIRNATTRLKQSRFTQAADWDGAFDVEEEALLEAFQRGFDAATADELQKSMDDAQAVFARMEQGFERKVEQQVKRLMATRPG